MRFESFLKCLDLGRCEDQLQREALFELALLFVMVDGVITESENQYMQAWLNETPWASDVSIERFYQLSKVKCVQAIQEDEIDTYIAHRASQLIDQSNKQQALRMAEEIANVDGELDPKEAYAIDELKQALKF